MRINVMSPGSRRVSFGKSESDVFSMGGGNRQEYPQTTGILVGDRDSLYSPRADLIWKGIQYLLYTAFPYRRLPIWKNYHSFLTFGSPRLLLVVSMLEMQIKKLTSSALCV